MAEPGDGKEGVTPPEPIIVEGNDKATQARERLNYQCFLLDYWRKFCRSPYTKKGYGGGKRFTCVIGSPSDLTQKLTSGKGRADFLNLTTAQISSLMPRIKLFVIPLKPNGSPRNRVGKEIKFSTFYNEATIEDITSDARSRGDGCGLKSLSYELYDAGSTELASQRQKIIMKFYGESLQAIAEAEALDLAIRSEKYIGEYDDKGQLIPGRERPNSNYSALKLVYGWAIPPAENDMFTKSQRDALKASTQSLMLTLTDHTLSFSENGSVELECEYEGYVEAKLSELEQNILWPSKEAAAEREKAELGLKNIEAKKSELQGKADAAKKAEDARNAKKSWWEFADNEASEQLEGNVKFWKEHQAEVEKNLASSIAIDKGFRYSRLLEKLNSSGRIFSYKVKAEHLGLVGDRGNWFSDRDVKVPPGSTVHPTAEQVANMSEEERTKHDANEAKKSAARDAEPPFNKSPKKSGDSAHTKAGIEAIDKHAAGKAEGDEEGAQKVLTDFSKSNLVPDGDTVEIEFMYYGDILDVVLESAYDGKEVPIKYLVGPLNFRDPLTGKWETICIADIPISLDLFLEFWMKNVVSAGRETYSIKQFLFQSAKELIVSALGDSCFPHLGRANTNPAGISITTFSVPALQNGNPRVPQEGKIGMDRIDILGSAANATSRNHHEYVYIYCSAWTSKNLDGNRAKDAERGIYHVAVGQDRGPVKKVAFEKTDIQFQRTAAAMRGGGIDRLAAMYNANLTMVGNAMFMPGNYVFVAPTSMGMSAKMATKLGLGGYYTITKLTGVVDSSGWTCDIKCRPLFTSATDRSTSTKGRAGVQPVTKPSTGEPPEGSNPENKPK